MIERGQLHVHTRYQWDGPSGTGFEEGKRGRPSGREVGEDEGEGRIEESGGDPGRQE